MGNRSALKENNMRWWKKQYLRLSDCDGMCGFCEPRLKEFCEEYKNEYYESKNVKI